MAIACAALGDDETARSLARRGDDEEQCTEAFAQLAAYAACLPGNRVPVPLLDDLFDFPLLARRLASSSRRPALTSHVYGLFLVGSLNRDGLHRALPVFTAIAPDAVHRVRDVVFAHLGLSGRGCRP